LLLQIRLFFRIQIFPAVRGIFYFKVWAFKFFFNWGVFIIAFWEKATIKKNQFSKKLAWSPLNANPKGNRFPDWICRVIKNLVKC
jgi:hypothetical protein